MTGGKGDKRRPQKVSDYIMKLRWELWQKSTTPERKEQIKKELEKLGS